MKEQCLKITADSEKEIDVLAREKQEIDDRCLGVDQKIRGCTRLLKLKQERLDDVVRVLRIAVEEHEKLERLGTSQKSENSN